MRRQLTSRALAGALLLGIAVASNADTPHFTRVLLLSIDGMHAVDLANCIHGIEDLGPYCPTLATLAGQGLVYTQASTPRPSDSFPGLLAMVTGGTPRSAEIFYDDSYDRVLAPPLNPNNGINNGVTGTPCIPGVPGPGTEVRYDESLDANWDPVSGVALSLDGGGALSPQNMARDPLNGCTPVLPHQLMRVNTIFEVIKQAGGHTAWSDKHRAYDIVNGPSGTGVDDLFTPEINSLVPDEGIPGVTVPAQGACSPAPDPGVADWTSSFADIKCYDQYKVNALLHEIEGLDSSGTHPAAVPTIFGMNFQAVSVGQKLVEQSLNTTGGYLDGLGKPSPALLGEIQFVDGAIGQMLSALEGRSLRDSTLIIISAKHGQSPIDPQVVNKPGDVVTPLLNTNGIPTPQVTTDDVALVWLQDQSQTVTAADVLSAHASDIFLGQVLAGPLLDLLFQDPATSARTPDLIVTPNVGTIYSTSGKKIAEHGGFARDDTNVMLLVSNPHLSRTTIPAAVQTTQIAPTIPQGARHQSEQAAGGSDRADGRFARTRPRRNRTAITEPAPVATTTPQGGQTHEDAAVPLVPATH